MSGKEGIFRMGFERSEGVPDRVSVFPPFTSESFKMDRPLKPNPNIDRTGAETRGRGLEAKGAGSITGAADTESWLIARAHMHGYYEVDDVIPGVYDWTFRKFNPSTDTRPDHYLESLFFGVWRAQKNDPREYVGTGLKFSEFELSVDANGFVMYKHDGLYLRDRYMANPAEVDVDAAYTGDWVVRGHRRSGDELGPDLDYAISTAGALGVAKIRMGSSVMVTLTSVGTVATAHATVPHGLSTGDKVTIAGVTPAGYNVTDAVITVTSATTFTYVIVSVAGAPGVAATRAIALDDTEYLVTDAWINFVKANGTARGTREEPVQIRATVQTGDVFTLGDAWRISPSSSEPVPVVTDRERLTANALDFSFTLGGSLVTIPIAKSYSLKHGVPREAKEGIGSKYMQSIGEPNESREYWELTFPRTYIDLNYELGQVSETSCAASLKLWGTEFETGYEDFASFTLPKLSITSSGATIQNAGDNDETVTFRAYTEDGSPLCTETYRNSVASIIPT